VPTVVLTSDQDVLAFGEEGARLVLDTIEESDLVTLKVGAGHMSLKREHRIARLG
jgi:hypothetical protein